MNIITDRKEIVNATNGDNAVIVIDCSGMEDPFYECYRAEDCIKVVEENKYADRGYITPMNSMTLFRDAHNDGKNRLVFHREICCLSSSFTATDILRRAHAANLKMVTDGDPLTIIAKVPAGVVCFTTRVDRIDQYRGEIKLVGNDDVRIATAIFNVLDRDTRLVNDYVKAH